MPTLYFDESGFSGNNLLDPEQRIFTCSSIAIDPIEAKQIVCDFREKYRIKRLELKGNKLLRNRQEALLDIINIIKNKSKIVIFDKNYALAGKYFEFIFDPLLADISLIFYNIDFHLFIQEVIYYHFEQKNPIINELFLNLSYLLKPEGRNNFFLTKIESDNILLNLICRFSELNRYQIINNATEETNSCKWLLDLTSTSLYMLLNAWDSELKGYNVVFDESKPLIDALPFFSLINNNDKTYFEFSNKKIPMSLYFKNIECGSSKNEYGIQLADLIASSYYFAFMNPCEEFSQNLFSIELNGMILFPEKYSLKSNFTIDNYLILNELTQLSENKTDLIAGMRNYFIRISNDTKT